MAPGGGADHRRAHQAEVDRVARSSHFAARGFATRYASIIDIAVGPECAQPVGYRPEVYVVNVPAA
jgi:hypothetical protein